MSQIKQKANMHGVFKLAAVAVMAGAPRLGRILTYPRW
jgi:hypothetical protein